MPFDDFDISGSLWTTPSHSLETMPGIVGNICSLVAKWKEGS
jgi:hypothetical protein